MRKLDWELVFSRLKIIITIIVITISGSPPLGGTSEAMPFCLSDDRKSKAHGQVISRLVDPGPGHIC